MAKRKSEKDKFPLQNPPGTEQKILPDKESESGHLESYQVMERDKKGQYKPSEKKDDFFNVRTETMDHQKPLDLKSKKVVVYHGSEQLRTKVEKPVYSTDERRYTDLIDIYSRLVGNFQSMLSAYGKLNLGPCNRERLGILHCQDMGGIKKEFYTAVEKDIEKTDFAMDFIRDSIRKPALDRWNEFERTILDERQNIERSLRHYTFQHGIELNYLTLNNNNTIQFTDKNRDDIKQNCSAYLDTKAKRDFIKKVETAVTAFNQLWPILEKNGFKSIVGPGSCFDMEALRDRKQLVFNKNIIRRIIK